MFHWCFFFHFSIIIIHLHTVVWFQVFLSNTKKFQLDLFESFDVTLKGTTTSDLGNNGHQVDSTYSSAQELEPHHWK